ncbi:MAG: lipase [Faecalibacterium sp.]|nr:lipase [Faecalibacterium sp.]
MSNFQGFDAAARRRRRFRRRMRGYTFFAGSAAAILIFAWIITSLIEGFGRAGQPQSTPLKPAGGVAAQMLAPLPMQGGGVVTLAEFGPAQQSESYTLVSQDAAVIRQPECGQVDLSYFADAAFLGDSLTEGFTDYNINLGGALVCGYVGVSPNAVVNRTTVKHMERGEEVALDVLAAHTPQKLYILLGTNALTATGNEKGFLGYYSQMLDTLKETLGEDCVIYVQSIPPVRPEATESRPGLASEKLRSVNEQLAQLALEKGCCYIDLWQALADSEGNLNSDYSAPDGVHLTAGRGYTAWVNYLRTHTLYDAASPWTPGSAYAS